MLTSTTRQLICVFFTLILCLTISCAALAGDQSVKAKELPCNFTVGSWDESNTDKKKSGDTTFIYKILNYKKLHLRMDTYTGQRADVRRYWAHYGRLPVYKTPSFNIGISPGAMMLTSRKPREFFYGGIAYFDFPKLGFNVEQRSYAGTKRGLHYTFSNVKLNDNFLISYVYYTYELSTPCSYLGPKIAFKIGQNSNFHVFYGFSVNRLKPDARFLGIQGALKF
jgi:hypothetical protein